MKKVERLAAIADILERTEHSITADDLAIMLKVSTRTIYRDIGALSESGLPIIGEAGTGYTLEKNLGTNPVSFSAQEREALLLGAHMIKEWSDPKLADAATSALEKITSGLGEDAQDNIEATTLFFPPSKDRPDITIDISALRRAIRNHNIIEFDDTSESEENSFQTLHPLCAAFFGPSWLLVGWDPQQEKFCNFRLENIKNLTISNERFNTYTTPGKADFVALMQQRKTQSAEPNTEPAEEPSDDQNEQDRHYG